MFEVERDAKSNGYKRVKEELYTAQFSSYSSPVIVTAYQQAVSMEINSWERRKERSVYKITVIIKSQSLVLSVGGDTEIALLCKIILWNIL